MIFWRRKKNIAEQEQEEEDDRTMHPPGEPDLVLPSEDDAGISEDFVSHEMEEMESEVIDELETTPVPEGQSLEAREHKGGWISRLAQGLSKSSARIGKGLSAFAGGRRLDKAALEEIEDLLISADLGPETAARLVGELSKQRLDSDITDVEIREILAAKIAEILAPVARQMETKRPEDGPRVIVVAGVNGVGKTTTIGKLAHILHMQQKKSVLIAAGDTFRAAAIEQLEVWAERAHVGLLSREIGADAASVAYEACEKAKTEGTDILLIDTAGRLHNKANLMEELAKIVRVLKKQNENAPHEVLLVLDATTGQNAHAQVKTFREMIEVTGLIVTKLDGSARGGVVVSLADAFGLPVYAAGVGEKIEDLQPFRAENFARAIVGLDE